MPFVFWKKGFCKNGNTCKFAHTPQFEQEDTRTKDLKVNEMSIKHNKIRIFDPIRYKTNPCLLEKSYGQCRNGDKCQFYHAGDVKRSDGEHIVVYLRRLGKKVSDYNITSPEYAQ